MRARAIGAGVAGGLLAGAVVGSGEALAAWLGAPGVSQPLPALAWALLAYGAIGGTAGFGAGIVAAALRTDGFALACAGIGVPLAFAAGRFRIGRDVLLGESPQGALGSAAGLGALAACMVLGGWLWWRLRGAGERGRLLTRPSGAAAIVAAAAALWAVAARTLAPLPPPLPAAVASLPDGAPNVLLIVVDALRADHLGAYGSERVKTPHVDRLAADGVRYANAFAQASWTRPSIATILTSQYPSSHGAATKADELPAGVVTLAEAMAAGGYRTVGFADAVDVGPRFGFQQGFAEFHHLAPARLLWAPEAAAELSLHEAIRRVRERVLGSVDVRHHYQPAEVVSERATRWLDGLAGGQRFFMLAHYMDPHEPHVVHPLDGEGYGRNASPEPPAAVAGRLRELYEDEVAYLDEHLGVLFDDLRRRGLYDDTVIVLTADHGEELHEHGGWWHGATLYDEQTRVPLIVKPVRGGAAGRVDDALVAGLDVAPTVLAAAGLPTPPRMQGRRLPLDGAPARAHDVVFSEANFEGSVLQAIRSTAWKLVLANPGNPRGLPEVALFDLARDPAEQSNLAAAAPARVEELRAALGRKVVEARAHAGAADETNVDDVTRDRLKALGYVE